MKVIDIIEGAPVILDDSDPAHPVLMFWVGVQVDDDGTEQPAGARDPDYQPATSYKPNLDATVDRYFVLPPRIIRALPQRFLGCRVEALNTTTRLFTEGVVGDIGPDTKLGEGSVAFDHALGIPDSPINGGINDHVVFVRVHPDVPAEVLGKTYLLQSLGGAA